MRDKIKKYINYLSCFYHINGIFAQNQMSNIY